MKRRNMHLGAKPSLFRNAYKLRKNSTQAEEILWSYLRDRQMEGVKFRRQHPLKDYIPDFYANELKFAIELDGGYHNDKVQKFYDKDREEIITSHQVIILRFINEEVIFNINNVLSIIREKILTLKLLKEKKTFELLVAEYRKQIADAEAGQVKKGQEDVRLIWENIKPKLAKELILKMIDADEKEQVVVILSAMPINKQSKIVSEFKSEDEQKKLDEIMRLIRQGPTKIAPPTELSNR